MTNISEIQITIMEHEPLIRLGFFGGVLVLMALWEVIAPRRVLTVNKSQRWFSNVGIAVLNTLILRIVLPLTAVGSATIATNHHWGFLHQVALPVWIIAVLSIIVLDLIIYLQHLMFHQLPILWRLHKVHHADLDFDVTTGLRFHPIEILLSMGIKIVAILLLGVPAVAVVIFEVLLNATAMFNHSNIMLPTAFDRLLRWFVVTPDMHRVHHSTISSETNSNFGFNLPWWDYLFGTYQDQPQAGHLEMSIGLAEYEQDLRVEQLPWMLALPFLDRWKIQKL